MSADGARAASELQLGVLDDARRRQRTRRRRGAWILALAAAVLGLAAWSLAVLSSQPAGAGPAVRGGAQPAAASSAAVERLGLRFWPSTTVGRAGWCYAIEGVPPGGAWGCSIAPAAGEPFVTIFGWGRSRAATTLVAVTSPRVRAVSFGGGRRVATVALPGLPFGLRAASTVSAGPIRPLAFDSAGRQLAPTPMAPTPAEPARSWSYPARAPAGYCDLRAGGLPAAAALRGSVMTSLQPPARPLSESLLACAATEYALGGTVMKAVVLIGADGLARATRLPDFRPVPGAPGVLAATGRTRAHGALVGKRAGRGWIVVSGGRDESGQLALLRHLSATIAGA